MSAVVHSRGCDLWRALRFHQPYPISSEPRVFFRGMKPGTSEAPSLQLMHEAMSIDSAVHRDQIAQDNARNSKSFWKFRMLTLPFD